MTPDASLKAAAAGAVVLALAEDMGSGERPVDVTSDAVIGTESAHAAILANQIGVVAGLFVAEAVFKTIDAAIVWEAMVEDGDRLSPGLVVAQIRGSLRTILAGERTALNFLSHLSGVATTTRAFAEAVAGSGAAIYDTRKTTPGLRALEKYAVRVGGGRNHRFGLFDAVLIKDNHLIGRDLGAAVLAAKRLATGPIEVEVENMEQLDDALKAGADIILLDNMEESTLEAAVGRAKGAALMEVSGGVGLDNVAAIAALGAERISVGALTQGAGALDFSLTVSEVHGRS